MHNMGQLKSKQFYRRPSVEPISRASSFHTIDNKRHERYTKNKNRQSQNQNIYDLANIVQELQDLKPRTSDQDNTTFRTKRAETIIPTVTKLKSIPQKHNNPISLIDLIKQHRQREDQLKLRNTLQQDSKRAAIYKRSREKTAQNRKINQQINEGHINFQTIKFPQGVCKPTVSENINTQNTMFNVKMQEEVEAPKVKALSKNLTDYAFVPNNKISINNIDRLIFKHHKNHKKSPKNIKKSEKELIKTIQKQQLPNEKQLLDPQRDLPQLAPPKQRKMLSNHKIPEFIKASLQGYQQQSQYAINNLIIPLKINQTQNPSNNEDLVAVPQKDENEVIQMFSGQKASEENLMGAKLNLYQKQKRKSSKIIDYIRQRRENNMTAEQTSKRVFKLTSRQRVKKTCVQEEFNHRICGWEENGAPASDPVDFSI